MSKKTTNGSENGIHVPVKPAIVVPKSKASKSSSEVVLWGLLLVLAIAALIGGSVLSHRAGLQLQTATQSYAHTREVVEKLQQISAGLREMESSARSFAITGKQSQLDPFFSAVETVPKQLDDLKNLLRDDPASLQSIAAIEPVIEKHLKTMKDMVALGDKNLFRGFSQRDLNNQGNTLMDQIQATLDPLQSAQRSLLDQQQAAMKDQAQTVTTVNVAGCIAGILLVFAFGICALRNLRQCGKAEEKLDRLLASMPDALVIINADGKIVTSNPYTEKLFGYTERELQGERMALLVPERLRQAQRQHYHAHFAHRGTAAATIELVGLHKNGHEFPIEISTSPLTTEKGLAVTSAIRDISGRKKVEQQISQLNRELQLRARELEGANRELEAFSYSVSHDLRSPLQNIDSFSQILLEDYANRLNADGRDCVQRLRGSCEHMENIIEALLALSNMTRSELMLGTCDLSALAGAVAADIKQKSPDRLVEWVIADGLTAEADAQLLRVVLENLFGNAWKFTANRPRARIEFGALPQSNGVRTYFVRDDGAGFDMTRANNLFAPFKRLHDQNEFKGTGIGLATVQRVIQRHRGKIWAEGVVNQGATFCFTLNDESMSSNGKTQHFAA